MNTIRTCRKCARMKNYPDDFQHPDQTWCNRCVEDKARKDRRRPLWLAVVICAAIVAALGFVFGLYL